MARLAFLSRLIDSAALRLARLDALFSRRALRSGFALVSAAAAFGLAGCAEQPRHLLHGSEYFPQSIYGQASPRVVARGERIPRGGGVRLVGHPYTIAGHTYYPSRRRYSGIGLASWYGAAFDGRRTANGEIFDPNGIMAANPVMPLPSYARVTNLRNHYSMVVRVNDRGPFKRGRIMDVSRHVAELLKFRKRGTTLVKVDYIGPASLAGSNDRKLVATLRDDGHPARLRYRWLRPTRYAETPERVAAADLTAAPAAPTPPAARPASIGSPPVAPGATAFASTASSASAPPALAPRPAAAPARQAEPASFHLSGPAPLPPARPFDLDTIPGAAVPIGAQFTLARQ